jgi:hypothetical protein
MSRSIGSRARLNGKEVVWSGQNYGWQSPATHNKLKNEGKFKTGAQQLDRIAQSVSRYIPEPVKRYASAVQSAAAKNAEEGRRIRERNPIGRIQNRIQSKPNATERVLQATSDKLNVDRRIVDTTVAAAQAAVEAKVGLDALRVLPRGRGTSPHQAVKPASPVTRQSAGRGVQNRIQQRLQQSQGQRSVNRGAIEVWPPEPPGSRKPSAPQRRAPTTHDLSTSGIKVKQPKVVKAPVAAATEGVPKPSSKPTFPNANNRTFPRGRQSATLPGKDPIGVKEANELMSREETFYGRIIGSFDPNPLKEHLRVGDFRSAGTGYNRAALLRAQDDIARRALIAHEGNVKEAVQALSRDADYQLGRVIENAAVPEAPITWHGRKYKVVDGKRVYIDTVDAPQRIKERLQRRSPVTNTEVRKRNELQKAGQLPEFLNKDKTKAKLKDINQRFSELIDTTEGKPPRRRPVKGSRNRPIANSRFDDSTWRYKDQNEPIIAENRRIRNRLRTIEYEKFFEEMYPRSNYPADLPDWKVQQLRNKDFARDYPYGRFPNPQARLKTDNTPGKSSIKNVFREAQERRGHVHSRIRDRLNRNEKIDKYSELFTGDGVYRERGKADPQWVDLSKNPDRRPRTPRQFVEAPKTAKSKRVHPRKFKAQHTVETDRTVPIGYPLNRGFQGPVRPKGKSDRIRRRILSNGNRDGRRLHWLDRFKQEARKGNTPSRRTGRLQQRIEETKKRREQARQMRGL